MHTKLLNDFVTNKMFKKHRMLKRNINLNIYMHRLGACKCKYMSQPSLTVDNGKLSSCNTKLKKYSMAFSHIQEIFMFYQVFLYKHIASGENWSCFFSKQIDLRMPLNGLYNFMHMSYITFTMFIAYACEFNVLLCLIFSSCVFHVLIKTEKGYQFTLRSIN